MGTGGKKQKEKFNELFQLPPAMVPYVDLIVTDEDVELALGLADKPLTKDEIAEMMRMASDECDHFLEEAVRRFVVHPMNKHGATVYSPAVFYDTMEFWTSYETGSWLRVPAETRQAVSAWQEQWFMERYRDLFQKMTTDPEDWMQIKNRDVLLLDEVIDMVENTDAICLLRCDCKTSLYPGSPVIEGSMRIGERGRQTLERGRGRSLTKDEAKAQLLFLDRMGLIHTGPRFWRQYDPNQEWVSHGNCHPAYSFPMRAGIRLGLGKEYPRVHYTAQVNWEKCTHCGACAGRCLFGAFYHDGAVISLRGHRMRQIKFEIEKCWGCGLCSNTCPQAAIDMKAL